MYQPFRFSAFCMFMLLIGSAGAAEPGENRQLLERGRYLAQVGNCKTCHTTKGQAPFSGGVAFETDFGTIYSTNITSDKTHGIGNWSIDNFSVALREGIAADGTHLYPVFPYPFFSAMTDDDIAALWSFISTVAADSHVPPENALTFPFQYRGLLSAWKFLFHDNEAFTPDPAMSNDFNRGAYLVESVAHCGACHTPRNMLGAVDSDLALSGGTYRDLVEPGKRRPWSASNLTPAPDGLASWTREELSRYLRTGHSDAAGTFGPMNKVITENTSQLSQSDVDAISTYLTEIPAITRSEKHTMSDRDYRDAELLYTIHCGTCHLPTGLGDPSVGPRLAGSAVVQAADPASLINSIIYGAHIPQPAPEHAWESMDAFGDELDDEEIALLATYLRANWGNLGGAVTESQVAAQR